MKIQFHRIDTNVVVGLLVREFCCSGTDVSAKVLAMYAGTRTPSMEPQWLAAGLSQPKARAPVYYQAWKSGRRLLSLLRGSKLRCVGHPYEHEVTLRRTCFHVAA